MRPISLEIRYVALNFSILLKLQNIPQSKRVNIDSNFVICQHDSILVLISVVVAVSHAYLDSKRERIDQVVVHYTHFLSEDVFHHVVNSVGINQLIDPIFKVLR